MVLNTDYIYEYFFDNAPNGTIDAILAAPPCTDFASSGAQYWPEKDRDGRTAYSLELVRLSNFLEWFPMEKRGKLMAIIHFTKFRYIT